MTRRVKFYIATFAVVFAYAFLLFYLIERESYIDEKRAFVAITKTNSFSFWSQTPYVREQFGSCVGDIYNYHPGLLESKSATFINSGLYKRYE
ncbi:hypothetical protein [uncultured Campylobacter sp.]|uniref:hypothetical protein n=1 Tax=uncultured Campylobacter sp. TaxID=218934 RepID=UPI0026263B5A|nr:hypothetical protein [uncultured Campylobacter sp.]